MFFKKTKSLPALEKRLTSAQARLESLKKQKEKQLGDILLAQDGGGDTTTAEEQLSKTRHMIELAEKEIRMAHADIWEFHNSAVDQEIGKLVDDTNALREKTAEILAEMRRLVDRLVVVFTALGPEFHEIKETLYRYKHGDPRLAPIGKHKELSIPDDLREFMQEKHRVGALQNNQDRTHLVNHRVAASLRRSKN